MNIKKVGLIAVGLIVALIVLKIVMNVFIPFLIIAVIVGVCLYGLWKFWQFISKDKEVQSAVGDAKDLSKKFIDFINSKLK